MARLLWQMYGQHVLGALAITASLPVAAYLVGVAARLVAELVAAGWRAGWLG